MLALQPAVEKKPNAGCKICSFWADTFNGITLHLRATCSSDGDLGRERVEVRAKAIAAAGSPVLPNGARGRSISDAFEKAKKQYLDL
jgi:hypothetical protein